MPFPSSCFALAGDYTAIKLIAQRPQGSVYSAVDVAAGGRLVAVKEALPGHHSFHELCAQFEKERDVGQALSHPNIVPVFALKEEPQTHERYLISELVGGGSLADHLATSGPLPEPQAILIALDCCTALAEASARGFVHRDVKPGNILLVKDSQGGIVTARLADFGVARDLKRRATTQTGSHHPGTFQYMAPEQADITQPVDARTDLYALGICLWEMLTCTDYKPLLVGGVPDLSAFSPRASQGVAEVIRRAVQDNPADRYQSPGAMCADLRDVLAGRALTAPPTVALPPLARRGARSVPWPAFGALALALLLGAFGAWWLWPGAALAYERECEFPDESTVGRVIQRSAALNTMVHGQFGSLGAEPWPAQAGYVVYHNISVPREGHWSFKLRYSKDTPAEAPIQIFLDAEPAPRAVLHPLDQGDWDVFAWSEPIDLGVVTAGAHALKLATAGQRYGVADLDRFELTFGP